MIPALGAEINVPVLSPDKANATEKYTIPEGTQTGTRFTLRGKGIQDINTKRRGDLIFTVVVDTPQNLNAEQKTLLRSFSSSLGETNNKKTGAFFKKFFNR